MVKSAKQLAKQFFGTGPVGGVSEEKHPTGKLDVILYDINVPKSKVEQMDWEVGFDEIALDSDGTIHMGGSRITDLKTLIREAITTAVKEERERVVETVANMSSDWESRVSVKDVIEVI